MTPFTKHAKVPIADAFSNDVPHYYTSLYSTSHHLTTHDRQKYPQPRLPRNPCTKLIQIMTSVSEKDKTRAVRVVCRLLVLLLLLLLLALRWPTRSSFLLLDARQQPNERTPRHSHSALTHSLWHCVCSVSPTLKTSQNGDAATWRRRTTDDRRRRPTALKVRCAVCCVSCCVVLWCLCLRLCWCVGLCSVQVGLVRLKLVPSRPSLQSMPSLQSLQHSEQ